MNRTVTSQQEYPWASHSDQELLNWRLSELNLSLAHSNLQTYIDQLYKELENKNLSLKPKIYLGDEWFSPEGMVAISIPFYLAHPRLTALEKQIMLEAEGETPDYFMKLLRHEAGHCFDHAFKFSKRPKWRKLFGSPDQEYAPETYRPKPYSRSFVQNLNNWYAQSHPDEDFAESFAVWLNPESDWRKTYKNWPAALSKLEYIDSIAQEVRDKSPVPEKGFLPYQAARMKSTLAKYYNKRRKENAAQYPDFYDVDLRKIFNGESHLSKKEFGASRYMQKNRKAIIESVSHWTGERKFPIESLVKKLSDRSNQLQLKLGRNEAETHLEVSAYLATLVTHYLFTGQFKRDV